MSIVTVAVEARGERGFVDPSGGPLIDSMRLGALKALTSMTMVLLAADVKEGVGEEMVVVKHSLEMVVLDLVRFGGMETSSDVVQSRTECLKTK